MDGFKAFLKSDVGFLRYLYPNEGLGLSASIINNGWSSPSYGYFSDQSINLMDNPSGSIMYPLSSSEYNSTPINGDKTLFGFYLYDDNDRFTNRVYRINFRRGQYNSWIRCELYDIVSETVIASQQLSDGLYDSTQYSLLFAFTPGIENNRPVLWCTVANRGTGTSGTWRCQDNRFRVWMDAGSGSIIPANSYTHHTIITDPNEQDSGDPDDPEKPGGPSGPGGGTGTYTIIRDDVPIPALPSLTAGAAGFVTLYNPSAALLKLLADELNSDNVIQWIINYFNKPQDMVAGLGIVPVQPTTIGSFKPKLGSKTIDIAMPVIEDQFIEKDCGTLDIYKFYGSAFDYSPYSQIQIFLPYIGLKELNVDEVMGKTIGVKYHIDLFNGNCVAFVTIYNSGVEAVRYQFSGNCLQQIPINATSYDDAITNGIRLATMAVASLATAGAAGAAAGAAAAEAGATAAEAQTAAAVAESTIAAEGGRELASSTLDAIMTSKPHVERSGSLGGSIGHMSVQTPFIVRVIPRQSLPDNYKHYAGYPSNITATLSSLTGYTRMAKVELKGIAATDNEIAEIYKLLYEGVIL